jgi:hypothetical protein
MEQLMAPMKVTINRKDELAHIGFSTWIRHKNGLEFILTAPDENMLQCIIEEFHLNGDEPIKWDKVEVTLTFRAQ